MFSKNYRFIVRYADDDDSEFGKMARYSSSSIRASSCFRSFDSRISAIAKFTALRPSNITARAKAQRARPYVFNS